MLALLATVVLAAAPNPARFASWGAEALEKVQAELYSAERGIYLDSGPETSTPASLSSLVELISALNAAASYDSKLIPALRKAVDSTAKYWNPDGPVPGFNEHPIPGPTDRSYTENALLSVVLHQSATVLGSESAADAAGRSYTFAQSGVAKGGGELDHEGDSAPKTSIAGAAMAFADLVQSPTGTSKEAISLYESVRASFRDPTTNLFRTSITDGSPSSATAGLMIDAASTLFKATQEVKYGEQARRLESSSLLQWLTRDGALSSPATGAEQLVTSWFVRIRVSPRKDEQFGATAQAYQGIEWLHARVRDGSGHYGPRWDEAARGRWKTWQLCDQAASIRAFYVAAAEAKALQKQGQK